MNPSRASVHLRKLERRTLASAVLLIADAAGQDGPKRDSVVGQLHHRHTGCQSYQGCAGDNDEQGRLRRTGTKPIRRSGGISRSGSPMNLHKSPLFSPGHAGATDRALSARALQSGPDRRARKPAGLARRRYRQSLGPAGDRRHCGGDALAQSAQCHRVDHGYRGVVDEMFEEIAATVPGFEMPEHQGRHPDLVAGCAGLLSRRPPRSGPHSDLSAASGSIVYPTSTPPFVTPAASRGHRAVRRRGRYALRGLVRWPCEAVRSRARARCCSWPLNAPHRVENLDTVNISMTISYTDEQIRRLRDRQPRQRPAAPPVRLSPKSRNLRGASFLAKAVMQKLLRDSSWVKRERKRAPPDRLPARRCQAGQARRSAEGGVKAIEGP